MTGGEIERADEKRAAMVMTQIISRGVRDERVLDAMRKVPRERFVREKDLDLAFYDGPLSIGSGQTISQPYIVAYMTEMLSLTEKDRVLEIGTGCGYQTAVLAEVAAEVYSVEIVEELSERARGILEELGYGNVHLRTGDGSEGWPEYAPFDAIMVTAAPARVPKILIEQLADGGRMIVPVGVYEQYLRLVTKKGDEVEERDLIGVRFVPMTGHVQREE
jgi:protein-L-isoaspartate(D-aspartate) O-methyltransferase